MCVCVLRPSFSAHISVIAVRATAKGRNDDAQASKIYMAMGNAFRDNALDIDLVEQQREVGIFFKKSFCKFFVFVLATD